MSRLSSATPESQRAAAILEHAVDSQRRLLDRAIAWLMAVQWLAGIGAALIISPRTWIGSHSSVHLHVWAAVVLGGIIALLPVALAVLRPGRAITRHVIAAAQMLFSALLIHLTGGRIETHFHVFGSLAFLAFYLDWKILVTATVVVCVDHFVRGVYWPLSVFGVEAAGRWRWLEHGWWVVFENAFLVVLCRRGLAYMGLLAAQQARLEAGKDDVEKVVRQRTAQLEEVQRIARLGSWVYNPETLESWWSREMYALLGWDEGRGPAKYEETIRLFVADDGARLDAAVRRTLDTGEPFALDLRLARRDHGVETVHSCGKVERDSSGHVVRLMGTMYDITARKRMERALQASEAHFRLIVDNSLDAILTINEKGLITAWNPQAEATFGWSAAEVLGRPMAETIISPEFREAYRAGLKRYLESGDTGILGRRIEVSALRKSGEQFPIELAISPLRTPGGLVFSAFVRDITDQKRAARVLNEQAEELRRARDDAEAASRSKSMFLANMSHEIRTPMTAILGFADLLLEPGQSLSDRVEAIQVIKRNGEHLLSLINDILDLSKIEAGRIQVERGPVPTLRVVEEVLSLMQVRAQTKGLSLKKECVYPLPREIVTDALRLRQILVNLVGNAIKFTERGGVTVRILFERADRPMLRFDVIDTGIGLSESQLGRLFTPFSQVDGSSTRQFGGTGLGLAISRSLAMLLGGTIEARGSPGMGSTFTLRIDAGPVDESVMLTSDEAHGQSGDEVPVHRVPARLTGRVLLAEDGPDNQRLISLVLRKAGLEVDIAANGQAAVEMVLDAGLRGLPYDVVLMDMQMPVLDGYGATSVLRQKGCTLPIIALTAHAMSGDREKCLACGCDDYLTKPIDRARLIEYVASRLGANRAAA